MEKRSDKRGSILDLFLVFLLLLCLLGVLLRWDGLRRETGEGLSAHVLRMESGVIYRESADCLSAGETLYTASGEAVGEVRSIRILPAPITLQSLGRYYRGEWPIERRCILEIELSVTGRMRDGVLLLDGRVPLAVGSEQTLFSSATQLSLRLLQYGADETQK